MADRGLTHVALPVSNLDRSIAFYAKYAGMQVVHRRAQSDHPDRHIAWLSDLTRPFVVVLAEATAIDHPLGPFAHLGVACNSRLEVDRLVELARAEGCFRDGPHGDAGDAAGYLVNLADPDGHTLELSFGQNVTEAVDRARDG
jgi:catechol 2,3-dioxygenase-like lactoylglutathione lyase family enzyme